MRQSLLLLCCLMSWTLVAGEAKVKAELTPLEQLLEEQRKWSFEPLVRADTFVDLEEILRANKSSNALEAEAGNSKQPGQDKAKTLVWGKLELDQVEKLILARKWDDAMKQCEGAIKVLTRFADDAECTQVIERLKRYHNQADEAKTYEEAQAKFDALALRVEGILWSPTASMAIIGGESRALKLNDRVKDCVIINIDTNRVDFLFHYNRKRFEFQRYVGEDAKAGDATPARKK